MPITGPRPPNFNVRVLTQKTMRKIINIEIWGEGDVGNWHPLEEISQKMDGCRNNLSVNSHVFPDCLLLASQMPESKTAVLSSWQRACTHSGTLPADQAASQPTSQPARQ